MNANRSEPFQRPEIIAPIDRHFSGLMAALSGDSPEVKLAAALVSYYRRQGHICVDLEEYERKPPPTEIAADLGFASWPDSSRLRQRLRDSSVVGRPGDFRPLVLDESGRLYLHRYWKYEADSPRPSPGWGRVPLRWWIRKHCKKG